MKFRKDINGLRAFAVIAVVLFHFNASWMPGGFAGVDVFFVISGFLMTGIIFKGLENNNFSVLNFYVARANRIIPALAALCVALLVFGWFYLTPLEYRALGKHAASSVGFLSNVIYFTEAGYFDAASHEKWLLHTWSLSVEWQFYIIYPLVLLALKRIFSLKTLKSLIIVATVIGFIFSVYATYKWPSASYYLFPMRAWEMMLGGVAFLYPVKLQQNNKRLVEILGLILIVGSYIFITGDDPWPGYLALFPVLGTFLVIQAQRNESIITGNIIFQKLGAWSYSIYLWHWPFVVAIYTFSLPSQYIYIGMALSVLLGYLSYKYIERIKLPRSFPTLLSYLKCKPIYIAGIVGLLGSILFAYQHKITKVRLSGEKLLVAEQEVVDHGHCDNELKGCVYGEYDVKAIVIGDSHARSNILAINEIAESYKSSILNLSRSNCATVKSYHKRTNKVDNPYHCSWFVEKSINIAKKNPGIPVILINRGFSERNKLYQSVGKKEFKEDLIQTYCEVSKTNPLYLVRATPEYERNIPRTMFKNLIMNASHRHAEMNITRSQHDSLKREFHEVQDEAIKRCNNIKILDPTPLLCDKSYCYPQKKGIPLYFDGNHLSMYGAKLIAPIYEEVFK